jgi:hypothetical protein
MYTNVLKCRFMKRQVEFSQVFQRLKLVIRPRIRRLSDG